MKQNALTKLLGTDYPIIQAGMVWVSGGKLAGAASKAGCLGVIGAGSMKPDLLRHHIQKAKSISDKALAVNLPIMYPGCPEQIEVALEEGIKIFITSAGSPKKYTQFLKDKGCVVIHVTSTPELAKKCEAAGVDAIIAEGFEAGGHNGRDEITTMTLIPQVVDSVKIPVIAAGGIGDGRAIVAAQALGAQGVQMGTRFLMTQESSAHENFKNLLLNSTPGSTKLSMKELVPVRLFKNKFFEQVQELEIKGASKEELQKLLGKGRAKAGMLDGDLDEGELEVGQVCSLIKDLPTVQELVEDLLAQTEQVKKALC
ncbi:MAG: nitronate monooxygenase [Halobacteriovoraceae bacterium]|nr:nitronate monooxygenase [Halobacteriovoraceae bacterium]|tara:strand:- start:6649 stop:7587 length:939 start_codon:yes stop_codon:yes gene_type:complete